MKHIIPTTDWHMALAQILETAVDGDIIVVKNESQQELAKRAISRMRPELKVTFVISEEE